MSTGLLKKENISLDSGLETKEEVINDLAEKLYNEGIITDFDGFLRDIYAREELDNTALGFSVAIPHGKSKWITEARLAFSRLTKSINWGDDEEYVKFIFLIAIPEGEASKHIEVLAGLSQKILDDKFREKLETADIEEVLELINGK
ncbi:MAG: PTS sugar transporter subunit IIA [Sebaldella sp.]|nr:PTS sugar transporter subunit IIA [Sebaldella sp.]